MAAKHIATYPIYGVNPISGMVWRKRVGTGYITKPEQMATERERLERYGHPFEPRWRNDECRDQYFVWLRAQESSHA